MTHLVAGIASAKNADPHLHSTVAAQVRPAFEDEGEAAVSEIAELDGFDQAPEVSLQDLAVGYGPAYKRVCPSPAFVPRLRIGEEGKGQQSDVEVRAVSPRRSPAHTEAQADDQSRQGTCHVGGQSTSGSGSANTQSSRPGGSSSSRNSSSSRSRSRYVDPLTRKG